MSANIRVKVTVPSIVFDDNVMSSQLNKMFRTKTGPDIKRMFIQATSTWEPQPSFTIKSIQSTDSIGISVQTSDKRMALVNAGSKPHIIRAKRRTLSFRTGYRAKSRPGSLSSSAGGKFGPYFPYPITSVNHPGFPGRHFDETIQEQYQDTFEKDVQDTINQVARMPKS